MAEVLDEIERVAPVELIPYANNAKEHPDEQVKQIASSIKNYGWDQPIVVDGENEIIKGHGRLQAAELLDLDEVPVIKREDLSSAKAQAARIADNKTAESAWDDELLSIEVNDLTDEFDELELGFDEDEIDDLIERADDKSFLNDISEGVKDGDADNDNESINASNYVELSFTVTTEERAEINDTLETAEGDTRAEQLLSIIREFTHGL